MPPTGRASQARNVFNLTKACISCRSAKRRCDREQPQCARCRRRGIACMYSHKYTSNYPTAEEIIEQGSEVPSHPALTAYFLDRNFFISAQLKLPRVQTPLIQELQFVLGDKEAIHATASEYFDTIHHWLPIISKRRFYQQLMNPLSDNTADFVLTLLCMKICVSPFNEATSNLYGTVKLAILQAVSGGNVLLYTLQASVLLAIFEIGHALYPASFLSIGWCARLGSMLGIDKSIAAEQEQSRDKEEARRVWWSVLILDRFIALGSPQDTLATQPPTLISVLPIDDHLWDTLGAEDNLPALFQLGNASTLQLGRFARLAQTTHLLDQVIRLQGSSDPGGEDQRNQLCRALMALSHLHHIEERERRLEFCTQSAVCFSAILMLTSNTISYRLPEVSQTLDAVHDILPRLLKSEHRRVSPLLLNVLYKSAAFEIDTQCTPPKIVRKHEFEQLKATLESINERWRLAGAYLQMLESIEATTYCP